tara:strand:+ start:115 stop:678 length:564 start_codon:yes stop_codon:yes gene_type:complete
MSPFGVLRAALTWEWLQTGDRQRAGLKKQVENEMTQVGVLSALVLTIISAFLMLFHDDGNAYDEAWKTGVSVLLWSTSWTLMLMATVNSVLLLLASNECGDDDECEKFMARMGKLFLLPAQIFHISLLVSCAGIVFWTFNLLTFEYWVAFVGVSAVLYGTQTSIYWYLIYSVFAVKYEMQQMEKEHR